MNKKELPNEIINSVISDIEEVNSFTKSEKVLRNLIRITQSRIIKLIEKELKLVTKNHYRNIWLAIGMPIFGIAISTGLDKKACEERRQLDLEIKTKHNTKYNACRS